MSLASTDDLNWIVYHTEVQNDGLKFLILKKQIFFKFSNFLLRLLVCSLF